MNIIRVEDNRDLCRKAANVLRAQRIGAPGLVYGTTPPGACGQFVEGDALCGV